MRTKTSAGRDLLHNPARLSQMRRRALTFVVGALLLPPAYPQTATLQKDSFETGTIQSSLWNASSTEGCSATVQTGDAADGTHYLRSSLTANPPSGGNYRCEQNAKGIGDPTNGPTDIGDTKYYALSVRMHSDTPYDPIAGDTLMQLHHHPLGPPDCHQALRVFNNTLEWRNHCGSSGGPTLTLVSALPKNTWIRVCVKAKWETNSTGELKVWVNPSSENSTPSVNFSGQTLPNDYQQIDKFKIGNYKTKWRTAHPTSNMAAMSPRIFDHDDVRLGSSFAETCGGGSDQSEPPIPIPESPISVAVE